MTPAEVIAGLGVLAQLGGGIATAVEGLIAAIRGERPELLGPLPAGLPEVDAARAEAAARVADDSLRLGA